MFLDPDKPIDKHRVNLPHWQQDQTFLFVTWRLADSLPKKVIEKLYRRRAEWEATHPQPWYEEDQKQHSRLFTLSFEALLDDAHGCCILGDPKARKIVTNALLHFHGERYQLDCFVVMPNHVHVLFMPKEESKLGEILQTWKRFTAREINQAIGKSGNLWQREYWDRLIRSQRQLDWTRKYICNNPKNFPKNSYTLWQYGEGICHPFAEDE